MVGPINILVLNRDEANATALLNSLAPELTFATSDYTNTTLKAIQSHKSTEYQLCLISEDFDLEDVKIFTEDLKKINKDLTCTFVQTRLQIEPGLDREFLKPYGIDYIISNLGSQHDKEGLIEIIQTKSQNESVVKRVLDVDVAVRLLLEELDRVYENKKRGRDNNFKVNKISKDFIKMQAAQHDQILEKYYDLLIQKTDGSKPSLAASLEVPQAILKKQLPELSESTYIGASERVWRMLQQMHGKTHKKNDSADLDSSEPEATPDGIAAATDSQKEP